MAASVKAKYALTLTIDETLGLGLDGVDTDPTMVHDFGADSATLDANSSPPATKSWSDQLQLAAGAGALDLTALDRGPILSDVDFTGLKLQAIKLTCPTTNTGGITVEKKDAVTGYNPFGVDNSTAEKVTIVPGGGIVMFFDDELEDIDATHKDLTFTGTGTEAINIILVAG